MKGKNYWFYVKNNFNGKEYQGYFTQEELKEIMEETPYPYDVRIRRGPGDRRSIWIDKPKNPIKVWGIADKNKSRN